MDIYQTEPSRHKPGILLDPFKPCVRFYGNSFPEDAVSFFLPVIQWLKTFYEQCDIHLKKGNSLDVEFRLSYMNTSSQRAFLEIFSILKQIQQKGLTVSIRWYYGKGDSRMLECGQELSSIAGVEMQFYEEEE